MGIQIVFFDLDGTLIDPQTGRISEKTVQVLTQLRSKGIKVCISTGRPRASLPDFGELELDAFSTFNGSLCYHKSEIIFSNPIPTEDVQKVIQNAAALSLPVSVAVKDRLAANGIDTDLADYYAVASQKLTVAEDFDAVCRQDVYQILIGCQKTDHADLIKGTNGVRIAISWDRAVDVIPANAGKGNGIRKILEYYQLDTSEAMAFGDSYNDIEMLQAVGTGVAMGNAPQQLKKIADEVCGSVSQDGIYHYCLSHGLIE